MQVTQQGNVAETHVSFYCRPSRTTGGLGREGSQEKNTSIRRWCWSIKVIKVEGSLLSIGDYYLRGEPALSTTDAGEFTSFKK